MLVRLTEVCEEERRGRLSIAGGAGEGGVNRGEEGWGHQSSGRMVKIQRHEKESCGESGKGKKGKKGGKERKFHGG